LLKIAIPGYRGKEVVTVSFCNHRLSPVARAEAGAADEFYYSDYRYRASANLILADTERDVNGEDSGHAFSLRLQFLI
jgi:hypothetical protein